MFLFKTANRLITPQVLE